MSEDGAKFTCELTSVEDCSEINAKLPVNFRLECPASLPTRDAIAEAERLKQEAEQAALATAEAEAKAQSEAQVQARAEADARANEKHIVLPGWEDVIVGRSPPEDARQKCSQDPDDPSFTMCRGCRSAKLPTPCIEVMVGNPDPDKVDMITTILPERETEAMKVIADLKKAWGKPARQMKNDLVEEVSWAGTYECASLVTSWIDSSGSTIRRAKLARRVVAIADLGSACAPSNTTSKAAQQPEAEDVCRGPNVMAVLAGVITGKDLDPRKMRHCTYSVIAGRVLATTRDGWVIVSWSDSFTAAFKSRKRYADGAMFTPKTAATFTGIKTFEMRDGRTSTVATFKLSE